jgi:hypothetical protein
MVKTLHNLFLLFLFVINLDSFSQKTLQVFFMRFGTLKKIEVYNGEVLEYKLNGEHRYRRNKIVNLQDSFIVFSNDTIIKLDQLKAICVRKSNFLMRQFQKVFIAGGGLFFVLNTTNNLINERSPVLDQNAALIGAGLISTGFLIKQIGIRRIRITKHKQLKIIDLNFNNLSDKTEN